MGGYPPGTTQADLERAGIIDPEVDCPECDATVNRGEEHEEWCECEMNIQEMRNYWAEQRHPHYEDYEDEL